MDKARFRFYADLNRFLPAFWRQRAFLYPFTAPRSVKDMIEAAGVPHTEVALILVNGQPVDFAYHVQDGDRVSIYPSFRSIDISPLLGPGADPPARFVADIHLGRLVAYLRMLGFDTLYPDDYRDEELARISGEEDRILLTRDRGLLKRSQVTHGYYVRQTDPWEQLAEVLARFDLRSQIALVHRCTGCNGLLREVDKDAIADQLQPKTRQHYDSFWRCAGCGKIYWKGSHFRQMEQFLARFLSSSDRLREDFPE